MALISEWISLLNGFEWCDSPFLCAIMTVDHMRFPAENHWIKKKKNMVQFVRIQKNGHCVDCLKIPLPRFHQKKPQIWHCTVIPGGMEKPPTRFCGSIMFNSLSCWVNSPFIVDETTIWNPQRLVPNQYYIMPAKLLVITNNSSKYEVKHVNGAWFGQWVYHIFRVYTSWPLWVWSILWVIYAY